MRLQGTASVNLPYHTLTWNTKEGRVETTVLLKGGTGGSMLLGTLIPKPEPQTLNPKPWVLPPPSKSWIISIIWLYIALSRTPDIDCYPGGGGAVPNQNPRTVNLQPTCKPNLSSRPPKPQNRNPGTSFWAARSVLGLHLPWACQGTRL